MNEQPGSCCRVLEVAMGGAQRVPAAYTEPSIKGKEAGIWVDTEFWCGLRDPLRQTLSTRAVFSLLAQELAVFWTGLDQCPGPNGLD